MVWMNLEEMRTSWPSWNTVVSLAGELRQVLQDFLGGKCALTAGLTAAKQ